MDIAAPARPTAPPAPDAPVTVPLAPRAPVAVPGRDLALFLLLLAATDLSGLLHVYSLSSVYSAELFYGLGALVALLALGLLVLPAGWAWPGRGRWHWGCGGQVAATGLALGLGTLGVQELFMALPASKWRPGLAPLAMPAATQRELLLLVLGGLSLVALALAYTGDEATRRRWLTLVAAAWFAYAVGNLLFHLTNGPAGPAWSARLAGPWPWVLGALALVAVGGLIRPYPPPVFLGITLAVGGSLRLLALSQIPVSMNLGDMLPLINLSTNRLLAGLSPYHLYQMPYDLALTYWPLNMLPFVPFQAAGLDLRGANLLLGLGVAGALLWLRRGRPDPGWACYAFGVLYLTPTMFQWDLVTAAPPFWLWLCVLFAVVVGVGGWRTEIRNQKSELINQGSGIAATGAQTPHLLPANLHLLTRLRHVLPGAALGAAFAAGPLVLPFAPFVGLWWLRRGWRYAAVQVAAAAVVGAVAVLPFVLWDRSAFWLGAVSWFNNLDILPRAKWDQDKSWLYEIGFAGQLWQAGLENWLKPLQGVLLGGLALLSWGRLRAPADVLRWGSAAYLLFMIINPVIWPYLFTPALLGLVFTLAARGRGCDVDADFAVQ